MVGEGLHHTSYHTLTHTTQHQRIFCFAFLCIILLLFSCDLDVVFGRHGICVDGASARQVWRSRGECVETDGGLRKLQAWFPSLQTRSSQTLSLKIRREATESRLYRHADWPLGDFAIKHNTASRVLQFVFVTRSCRDLCIRSASLLRLLSSGSTRCV